MRSLLDVLDHSWSHYSKFQQEGQVSAGQRPSSVQSSSK